MVGKLDVFDQAVGHPAARLDTHLDNLQVASANGVNTVDISLADQFEYRVHHCVVHTDGCVDVQLGGHLEKVVLFTSAMERLMPILFAYIEVTRFSS